MNELIQQIVALLRELRPWVIVNTWEKGVRVRLGRRRKVLEPGPYWKIPFAATVVVLPCRKRYVNPPLLDLQDRKGSPLTIGLTIGYRIFDVDAMLHAIHQPEDAVCDVACSFVAEFVRFNDSLDRMEIEAAKELSRKIPGIGGITVAVTALIRDRRLRLVMDQRWANFEKTVHPDGSESE